MTYDWYKGMMTWSWFDVIMGHSPDDYYVFVGLMVIDSEWRCSWRDE